MSPPDSLDPLRYYNLESYLLEDVGPRFRENGVLTAFEFMSIVIWKANRSKSKIAKRVLGVSGEQSLELATKELARSLFEAKADEDRLRTLLEDWGFRLPMATALLAVLWPDRFTVYDVRVCESLGTHQSLANKTRFDVIWRGYLAYRDAVQRAGSFESLRDCDRALWARSVMNQLARDIRVWEEDP